MLSTTVFGDWFLLGISFTYCNEIFRLFVNIKNENFGQKLNANCLPQPLSKGGTKIIIFFSIDFRAYVAKYNL